MPLTNYIPNAGKMLEQLQLRGKEYGVEYNHIETMPNTHKALLLGEYAKTVGKQEALSTALFKAYFTDGINISKVDELITIAQGVGITKEEVFASLVNPEFEQKLEEHKHFCNSNQITSVPTFIINDQLAVVGSQSPETFKQLFKQLEDGSAMTLL